MITVFTPTYNRAKTIHRVWDSLSSQSYKDFEWIVVDDGSEDNIEQVIKEYQSKSDFPIIFKKLDKNSGKHVAINHGVQMASGELFLIADSDDAFKNNTLDFLASKWNEIPIEDKDQYCSIRVCCEDQFGNRVSDFLPDSPFDSSMAEAYYKHNFRKESWSADKTELLRENPFPDDHVGYFPEGIIWKKISRDKKVRFFNDVLRVYFVEENSIMRNTSSYKKKVNRNIVSAVDVLKNDIKYFFYAPLLFIKSSVLLCFYSLIDGSFLTQMKKISLPGKLLMLISFPVSYLIYAKEIIISKN